MQSGPTPSIHPRPLAALWRALTHFDHAQIHVWVGLRNALGVTLPLAVGVHLGYPGSGLTAATGALNVAAADGVDSYRLRWQRMLTSSVFCALAVWIGALAAPHSVAASIARTAWAFGAGLVVCLGATAADIAMISLVVFTIYSEQPMTAAHAAWSGLAALGGGLLQTVFSIALWPVHARRPERQAIAALYAELKRAATAKPDPYASPLASAQSTAARQALSSLANDHSIDAERQFMLVSEAERMRLSLFALNRVRVRLSREPGGETAAAAIAHFLEAAGRVAGAVGASLQERKPAEIPQQDLSDAEAANAGLRALGQSPFSAALAPHLHEARLQMDALAGQLRAAAELARNATPGGENSFAEREARVPWNLQLGGRLATIRANLTLESSALRHAVRIALCFAVGGAVEHAMAIPWSYWLPMTIALVLKPDFGATFSRGVLRLAGTYAGLLLATFLFHFVSPAAWAHVLWVGILVALMRSLGRANYGILVMLVSALVVFLLSLIGLLPGQMITARAINTTVGGAIALAIYWLWPTRERTQLPPALASVLDAYRLYFQAVSRAVSEGPETVRHELSRLRLNARVMRSNAETSLDRLSAEPYADPQQLRLAAAILASSHRFVHAVMAVEAGLDARARASAGDAWRTFSIDIEKTLYFLAASFRGSPLLLDAMPDLREDHHRLAWNGSDGLGLLIETDRMTNSLNTLKEQTTRWAAMGAPARAGIDQ